MLFADFVDNEKFYFFSICFHFWLFLLDLVDAVEDAGDVEEEEEEEEVVGLPFVTFFFVTFLANVEWCM